MVIIGDPRSVVEPESLFGHSRRCSARRGWPALGRDGVARYPVSTVTTTATPETHRVIVRRCLRRCRAVHRFALATIVIVSCFTPLSGASAGSPGYQPEGDSPSGGGMPCCDSESPPAIRGELTIRGVVMTPTNREYRAVVRRVLRQHSNTMRQCYSRLLQSRRVGGSVRLRFMIRPDGRVRLRGIQAPGRLRDLTTCIGAVVRRLRFPTTPAVPSPDETAVPATVEVTATLRLRPPPRPRRNRRGLRGSPGPRR